MVVYPAFIAVSFKIGSEISKILYSIMGAEITDKNSNSQIPSDEQVRENDRNAYCGKANTGSQSSLCNVSIASQEEECRDPYCNPENPIVISFQDVTSAAFKIKGGVEFTPCRKSHLSDETGMEIYLKKEFLQFTGSFKERGARYCLLQLPADQKKKGVISASLGNHAQGICYHGMKLNIPVTVVMPVTAPLMKVQKCRNYGANVIVKVNACSGSRI